MFSLSYEEMSEALAGPEIRPVAMDTIRGLINAVTI